MSSRSVLDLSYKERVELFKERFELSEESPSGLVWKSRASRRNKIGEPVGSIREGYWVVGVTINSKPKVLRVSRIICELSGTNCDNLFVDHLDGNPLNNSLTNLIPKTPAQNGRNQKKFATNTSGFTGLSISQDRGYEKVTVKVLLLDGTRKQKSFSFIKYGKDKAIALALSWRKEMIFKLNAQGAGYTERHGG